MASMVTCQSSCKLSLMASQHSLDVLLSSVFQLKTKIEESHYHNAGCVHSHNVSIIIICHSHNIIFIIDKECIHSLS